MKTFWKSIKKQNNEDLLILYATKSGNAKAIAELAHKYYYKNGVKSKCSNVSRFTPDKLNTVHNLLFVISTDGEGDPPPSAKKFFNKINSADMGKLPNLKYAVCALGDSSYSLFCEAGKQIDQRLQELNAIPFYPRTDCDVDFSNPAIEWIKGTYQKLGKQNGQSNLNGNMVIQPKKEFTGIVISKQKLSTHDKEKPCYHIEIETTDKDFHYQPGDSIELKPKNPKWLVDEILRLTKINPDTAITQNKTINQVLCKERELTTLSEQTLKKYTQKVNNAELQKLLCDSSRLSAYLNCRNLLDILTDFPYSFSAEELAEIFPQMRYRQYSIASSSKYNSTSIGLTVKAIKFKHRNKVYEGAASPYLCNTLDLNQTFQFRLYANPSFHLPEDNTSPIIMIATGTGIAPFRAFLQQRSAMGLKNKTWLIFGEKYSQYDFYYKNELEAFQKNHVLKNLDVVFSRDQDKKVYVQDVLQQKKKELLKWIQAGTHIYVCGSLGMGKSVRNCINHLLQENTSYDIEISSVDDLSEQGRYHEDIY